MISINDQPTEGWTGDMAAKLLRGKGGTEVRGQRVWGLLLVAGCWWEFALPGGAGVSVIAVVLMRTHVKPPSVTAHPFCACATRSAHRHIPFTFA